MHITKVLPIVGLDVEAISSSSLLSFGSGRRLVIWLFVFIFIFKIKPGSGYPGGRNSISPPSAILNVSCHKSRPVQNQNCYIEFDIIEEQNFSDLYHTFDLIKEAKNTGQPQPDEFWLANFPDYSLKQFNFLDTDLKPIFQTANNDEFTWHFYSLTSLLQTDYDISYVSCFKVTDQKGRIEYVPFGYHYGGITGLITFVASFDCKPNIIDDGTSLYQITFLKNGNFSITDLNDQNRQDSSAKRFNSIDLLRKFANRFK